MVLLFKARWSIAAVISNDKERSFMDLKSILGHSQGKFLFGPKKVPKWPQKWPNGLKANICWQITRSWCQGAARRRGFPHPTLCRKPVVLDTCSNNLTWRFSALEIFHVYRMTWTTYLNVFHRKIYTKFIHFPSD